jgi:D-psicose/D-tagatose/L-ribulose 3-epimerase
VSKLGVHALVWVGGWSEAECTQAIRSSAELGYDFIEIPLLNPYGFPVDFTRARLAEYRLGATASLGLSADTDISSENPEAVRRGEDLLNTAVSVVRDLGATHFCGVIYSALQKYMAPKTERGVANIVEVLRRVAEKANASGIIVGVEVVNRYETNIVNTAAEVVSLIERIDRPNVYAHLDTYHMNIEEGFVGQAIEKCGRRLGYFHVGESHRGYLGTGTIDFTAVFRSLSRIGYDGPIAFESFSSAVVDPVLSNMLGVWRNLWSDGYDLARHAKAFVEAQREAALHAVKTERTTGGRPRPA